MRISLYIKQISVNLDIINLTENIMHRHIIFTQNTLEKENRRAHAYKGHFYFCVQRKMNVFFTFTDAFGSFRRFSRVVTCLQLGVEVRG